MSNLKKKDFYLFIISLFPFFICSGKNSDSVLAIVLMVKDEEAVIEKTLNPYVTAGINSYLIYDTGSKDKTVERVNQFFKKNNITNGHIVQEDFIDFAASRNRALDLAEKKFPKSAFFLMPDAEWYMQNVPQLMRFCKSKINSDTPLFLVNIKDVFVSFYTPRLIKNHAKIRFKNEIHEIPYSKNIEKVPSNIFFELTVGQKGKNKSEKRWLKDLEILQKKFNENNKDPRITFYLAQTYECLKQFDKAYKYYKLRLLLQGSQEEKFIAAYRAANNLAKIKNKPSDWPLILNHYLEAYALRPWRIEPLIRIAKHYLSQKQMALAYSFALLTKDIPYPENDFLFIEYKLYDSIRYEILAQSSECLKNSFLDRKVF